MIKNGNISVNYYAETTYRQVINAPAYGLRHETKTNYHVLSLLSHISPHIITFLFKMCFIIDGIHNLIGSKFFLVIHKIIAHFTTGNI